VGSRDRDFLSFSLTGHETMFNRRNLIKGASVALTVTATGAIAATDKVEIPKGMGFYHDFSVLGLDLPHAEDIYRVNQLSKAPLITGYMLYAIGKLKTKGVKPTSVCELFCADAYYSFVARRFGADRCDAFDNDRDGFLAQARIVASLLKEEENVGIHKVDMFDMPADYRASIVVNAGGLYHVTDPLRAVEMSYAISQGYLVIQTVVSLANEDENYFETPAPGWTWGSRFSFAYLQRELLKRGYKILDSDRNILPYNDRPEDRGNAFFLISK
jgi:hypothetical protein